MPISLIGLPVDGAHGQRCTAAAIAVDAGHDDAGEADALVERAREVDRVLTGQRVGDQQHFMRIGGALHFGRFRHHRFVEGDAAGGVEHDDVIAAEPCGFDRALGDLCRRLALHDRQRIDLDLLCRARRVAPWPPGGAYRARPSGLCAC